MACLAALGNPRSIAAGIGYTNIRDVSLLFTSKIHGAFFGRGEANGAAATFVATENIMLR
jgi:hypothetical protein